MKIELKDRKEYILVNSVNSFWFLIKIAESGTPRPRLYITWFFNGIVDKKIDTKYNGEIKYIREQ